MSVPDNKTSNHLNTELFVPHLLGNDFDNYWNGGIPETEDSNAAEEMTPLKLETIPEAEKIHTNTL